VDRHVILVDVGYLLAEGGKAYCGEHRRSQVRCDYGGVSEALESLCRTQSELPLLRSYWYDGATDYVPTSDHLAIAELSRVKLRLGRLVTRRRGVVQKGVDSLIVHDMITLSHERAVAAIYVLAGDEDLREGVAAAQRLGVQVVVLGIPARSPNQALPLIREADEHILLEPQVLRQFFNRAGYQPGAEAPLAAEAEEDPLAAIGRFGEEFAREWLAGVDLPQAGELLAHEPRIPQELDVQMIIGAEEALGRSLRGEQELRHALRAAFWSEIRRSAAGDRPGPGDEVV
jgi:uncharacterized LabA/DUF88 family protein